MVGAVGAELALQEIESGPPNLAPVGTILLRPDQRLQSHPGHQALDGLVVDALTQPAQLRSHAAIAVAPLVAVEDGLDRLLQRGMAVRARGRLLPVIERAARQLRQFEQSRKRMQRP